MLSTAELFFNRHFLIENEDAQTLYTHLSALIWFIYYLLDNTISHNRRANGKIGSAGRLACTNIYNGDLEDVARHRSHQYCLLSTGDARTHRACTANNIWMMKCGARAVLFTELSHSPHSIHTQHVRKRCVCVWRDMSAPVVACCTTACNPFAPHRMGWNILIIHAMYSSGCTIKRVPVSDAHVLWQAYITSTLAIGTSFHRVMGYYGNKLQNRAHACACTDIGEWRGRARFENRENLKLHSIYTPNIHPRKCT